MVLLYLSIVSTVSGVEYIFSPAKLFMSLKPGISFSDVDARCVSGLNSTLLRMNNYLQTTPTFAQKKWTFWPRPEVFVADVFDHTKLGVGNYRVSVQVTDLATGCAHTDSVLVKIHPLPNARAYGVGSDSICEGDSIQLLKGYPEKPQGDWLNSSGIEMHNARVSC